MHQLIEIERAGDKFGRFCVTVGVGNTAYHAVVYTYKKEDEIFLIYKKIQMGSVSKSYMRKGLLIYEEMRKYLTKNEETISHI